MPTYTPKTFAKRDDTLDSARSTMRQFRQRPTLNNPGVGSRSVNVFPGQSIQKAIDSINSSGLGGTVLMMAGTHKPGQNLTLYSNISLVGEGRDSTTIDFNVTASSLLIVGTSSTHKQNVTVENLTIINSNATYGVDVQYCDSWLFENVEVSICVNGGLRIKDGCSDFRLTNVASTSNGGHCFDIDAT